MPARTHDLSSEQDPIPPETANGTNSIVSESHVPVPCHMEPEDGYLLVSLEVEDNDWDGQSGCTVSEAAWYNHPSSMIKSASWLVRRMKKNGEYACKEGSIASGTAMTIMSDAVSDGYRSTSRAGDSQRISGPRSRPTESSLDHAAYPALPTAARKAEGDLAAPDRRGCR
jgi:hypothetical protein